MATKKRKKQRTQHITSNKRRARRKPTSDRVLHSEYDITNEPLENPYLKHLPPDVRDTLDDLYKKTLRRPHEVIPDLERLIDTYPEVPMFANYLSMAYLKVRDLDKAKACVLEAYRRHPNYLFAKINYANVCLQNGDVAKIPGIFNNQLDLKRLYPSRRQFHVSEFTGFAGVMCHYFDAVDERDAAVLYYQVLKQVAPRDPITKQAKRLLYPPFWRRWLHQWAENRLDEKVDQAERRDLT